MDKWTKFRRLAWSERWLLAEALALLPMTALGLWLLGFGRTQAALARLAPVDKAGPAQAGGHGQARATAHLVGAAAQHGPYRANCLRRSLTLWWLLRRQGIKSEVRLGVRRAADRLEAHAWVELEGAALDDTDEVWRRYAAFERAVTAVGAGAKLR